MGELHRELLATNGDTSLVYQVKRKSYISEILVQAGDWVVLPFLNMKDWLNCYYDVSPSTFTPGAIDHITNANYFLKNFKQANPGRLEKCVTHRCSIHHSAGQSSVSIQGVCVEREGENPCGSSTH